MSVPFDLLLGRRTYDIFAAYWPNAPEEAGSQAAERRHQVRRLAGPPHAGVEQVGPDRGRCGRRRGGAEEGDGRELQVHGSGNLIQTLMRHDLVDEYRLWVFPVVLGSGKRLFAEGTVPSALKLVDSKVSTTGVVIGTYEPAGEIVTGSF